PPDPGRRARVGEGAGDGARGASAVVRDAGAVGQGRCRAREGDRRDRGRHRGPGPRLKRSSMPSTTTESSAVREELAITGMTCAGCAATIERALRSKVPGVQSATVNLATERA